MFIFSKNRLLYCGSRQIAIFVFSRHKIAPFLFKGSFFWVSMPWWSNFTNLGGLIRDFLKTASNGIRGWEFIPGSRGPRRSCPRAAARHHPSTCAGGQDDVSSQANSLKIAGKHVETCGNSRLLVCGVEMFSERY